MQRHHVAALAMILVSATAAHSALAAPVAIPQVSVRYADLDLNQPAGAQAMLMRIRHAATAACRAGERDTSHDINTLERLDACYRQSITRAVSALNAPLVTAAAGRDGFGIAPAMLAQNSARLTDK